MYSNLTKQREDFVSGMFVRNAINDLKQHELSMPIISIVGINTQRKDTSGITEWYCVGSVTMHSTENTNLRH